MFFGINYIIFDKEQRSTRQQLPSMQVWQIRQLQQKVKQTDQQL